ncbi:MAG: DVU_1551 family NTP transferase, partial [Candidatus Aminicenantales bacterium]
GHPILVDLKCRDEVLAIDPAEGLRRLMLVHPDDILEVDAGDGNILRDLDTPEDYKEEGIGLNIRRNPKRT